jgi:hypothetical protein
MFMTLTFNTKWPEVQEMLLQGQTAFMRADIVTQVFKARLEALLHNLRSGKYFNSKLTYIMRVSMR